MNKLIGYIAVLLAAGFFGLFALFETGLQSLGFNTFNILATRYVGTSLILICIAIFSKNKTIFKINKKQLLYLSFVSIVFYGGTSFILFISFSYIPSGIAQTLHFLYPAVVFVLCIITKQEELNKRNLLGLVLSSIGLLVISNINSNAKLNTLGIILAIISAFTFAFYMLSVRSKLLKDLSSLTYVLYLNLSAGIFYFIVSLILPPVLTSNEILPIFINSFGIVVFTTFLASFTLTWGIKKVGSSSAAILCCLEPITATVVGFICLNETLSVNFIFGSILILTSTVLIASQK